MHNSTYRIPWWTFERFQLEWVFILLESKKYFSDDKKRRMSCGGKNTDWESDNQWNTRRVSEKIFRFRAVKKLELICVINITYVNCVVLWSNGAGIHHLLSFLRNFLIPIFSTFFQARRQYFLSPSNQSIEW